MNIRDFKQFASLKFLLGLLALTLFYFVGALAGRATDDLQGQPMLGWPPAGIALAGILLLGYRSWPAIVAGALAFSWFEQQSLGVFTLAQALGGALSALACAWVLRRGARFENSLERVRDTVAYLLLAGGLGATLNALFSLLGVLYEDRMPAPGGGLANFTYFWVRYALALLVVTPFLITWAAPLSRRMNFWRGIEAGICAASLICGTWLAFNTQLFEGPEWHPLVFLPCPLLFWSALRFGARGAATGSLLVAGLALFFLKTGQGAFNSAELASGYMALLMAFNLLLAAAATERRSSSLDASSSETRLRLMLAEQGDCICRFKPDGEILYVNEAFCRAFHAPEYRLLGADFFFKLNPAKALALREQLAARPADQPVWTFDRPTPNAARPDDWQQISIRRLRHTDDRVEYQAVIQNISARKRVELELQEAKQSLEATNCKLRVAADEARDAAAAANRASHAKSEFLANMSHEIRTPLSGVLGMIELLAQTRLDPRQKELALAASENANALLHVINDVLDFSKIEAGKMTVMAAEFSLRTVVDGVLENVSTRETGKKITLAAVIRRDIPRRLIGAGDRIRQVLLNLVGNGVKFTDRGEVIIRVLPISGIGKHVRVRFEISDTGPGLSENEIKRLFQPFEQADNSSSRRYGGTGLGLAISRKLVGLMGGQIGVQSIPGNGSTFWFELPLDVPPQPPLEYSFPGFVFIRLLVAAPNASLRESLTEQLRGWGIDCREAATPDGVADFFRQELDSAIMPLVLCDDEMLALGGAALLQQFESHRLRVPCLLLAEPAAAMEKGVSNPAYFKTILLKPAHEQSLFDAVMTIFNNGHPEGHRSVPMVSNTEFARRETAAQENSPLAGLRILAAEDNPFNRRLGQMMLESLGAQADWVVNGREAVEKFKAGQYDAILMDGHMPELDGHEATVVIRQYEQEIHSPRPVRIIAITANALAGERECCLAAGMDDYITKPFTSRQLYQALLAALPQSPSPSLSSPAPVAPPASAPAAEVEFDPARLKQLAQGMAPGDVTGMVNDFLAELPDRLAEFERCRTAAQWPELKRAAHSLQGLFQLFGFTPLAEKFRAVEMAVDAANPARVEMLSHGLKEGLPVVAAKLQHWLETRK